MPEKVMPRTNLKKFLDNDLLRKRLVDAIQELKNNGTYQIFVDWHDENGSYAHGNVNFLPWHRVFIRLFEIKLQEIDRRNYPNEERLSLPYWRWSDLNDSTPNKTRGMLWENDFLGSGTQTSEENIFYHLTTGLCKAHPERLEEIQQIQIGTNINDNVPEDIWVVLKKHEHKEKNEIKYIVENTDMDGEDNKMDTIGPWLRRSVGKLDVKPISRSVEDIVIGVNMQGIEDKFEEYNVFIHPILELANDGQYYHTILDEKGKIIGYEYKWNDDEKQKIEKEKGWTNPSDEQLLDFIYETSFSEYLETEHGNPHVWVGGHMANTKTSPNDPIFFFHHCYVDKMWADWQAFQIFRKLTFPDVILPKFPKVLVNKTMKPWTENKDWQIPGMPTPIKAKAFTPLDVLNWTKMGAKKDNTGKVTYFDKGLGGYEYDTVTQINF